jgi:glycogen phosphorylase
MKHPTASRSFEVVADLPNPLAPLRQLAYNFRWAWRHETRELFREIDKVLWERVEHNPVQLLNQLSPSRIEALQNDRVFLARLEETNSELEQYMTGESWFDRAYPDRRAETLIAYFCAEFGVSEALPIYSGGLGILAGDHLKAASDLGIPLVGVGLLYSRGYFRQFLSPDGWQQEHYPRYDFYELPLRLVRGDDQQPLQVQVEMPDRVIDCQIWRADIGRVPLYLLDSNVLTNEARDQGITDTLYGGDEEMRIRQEMILGIGGMRALRALGLDPTVCHMNEGHSAFLSLERIRQFMLDRNCDYRTARQAIVNGNVFTTHTPVPAGFDLFSPELLKTHLTPLVESIGLTFPQFVRLGRIDPENEGEAFNMAVLAMENANHVNGVSKLHAEVSRQMFQRRWPGFPEDEIPIEPVTNGVHTLTWVSKRMADLFDSYLGPAWRTEPENPTVWEKVWDIPDAELWDAREQQRATLVRFVRRYIQEAGQRRGFGKSRFGQVESILDPRILTIGFARRFATYKRATLMLSDRERLKRLLHHAERPIQILIAGKSHPRDDGGKRLIQDLFNFINHEGARSRMVFIEDYDMKVARALVQGVDVWLNNPRRPMEASGTSGMKVVPNGGLNCSVLDGWWDEGYSPGVGWAIGERYDIPDEGQQDWLESQALYHLLETEICPSFYHRLDGAVPSGWVERMKRSIADLAPRFSTSRMVREYAEKFYMPSADAYTRITGGDLGRIQQALDWRDRVRAAWHQVRIVEVTDDTTALHKLGQTVTAEALVELGGLSPEDVRVQALVGKVGSGRELIDAEMHDMEPVEQAGNAHRFRIVVPNRQPGHRGYTIRVIPRSEDVNVPAELPLVEWQR